MVHRRFVVRLERAQDDRISSKTRSEYTKLLVKWGSGDKAALDELIPLVYDELRKSLPITSAARPDPTHSSDRVGS